MRGAYGWIGGAFRYLGLALFDRKPEPGELLMDGIVVAPDARGNGIGTRLLSEVETFARDHGFLQVRLDVVDTNPDARRLYERKGFVETKSQSLRWLRPWLGFGASTTMVKTVANRSDAEQLVPPGA